MNQQCKIFKSKEIVYQRDPNDKKKIINGYKVMKIIGEGSYGKIKLAIRDNQEYAIKKFNKFILKKKNKMYKNPNGTTKYVSLLDEVYREIEIHQKLDHPNIIKMHEIYDDDEREKLYVILEYAEMGQILKWESKQEIFTTPWKFDELTFKDYTKQMLMGLQYLQQQYVAHRDIKPHNILLTKNHQIKICDFGSAQQLTPQNDRVKGTEGTFQFVAPECLRENKKSDIPGYNGHLADIWSLGVVLYCIVELRLPFQSEIMLELFNQIETKEIKMKYDGPAKELILQMLIRDTSKRPNATQLLDDPYFQ
ncbi:unnamed protein product [Paramecium primaurelia]|uniref:Protein kinase domain-containing protein n=1 Tax=Paramecium primaurelia TaxID=5886 RepID=A0A8S1NZE4_PARPR|nr:unnamed protein product [Paramecium primaurelia]